MHSINSDKSPLLPFHIIIYVKIYRQPSYLTQIYKYANSYTISLDLIINIQTAANLMDDIKTDTAAILVDTGTTLDGKIDTIDTNVDAILVDTGTTLQAELDGIQADTEDIQSRLPAALSSGNIKADVLAISTSTAAARVRNRC